MSNNNELESNLNQQIAGIFQANGVHNKNAISLDHIKNVELAEQEYIQDNKEKAYIILKNVTGEIFRCNLTHTFVQSTKKIPMFYVVARYSSKMTVTELFKIFLYFQIEDDVISSDQLLNSELNGRYILEMNIKNNTQVLDNNFGVFKGNKNIKNKLMQITKQIKIIEIVKTMMNESDLHKIQNMGDPYSDLKPPTITMSLRDI